MIKVSDAGEFVLQGHDPVTKTVCVEWRVWIANVDRLKKILGPDCAEDNDLRYAYYEISRRDMRRIGRICLPPIVPDRACTTIKRRHTGFDDVPYMMHTSFELPLMLEGRKPLAVFGEGYPSDWLDDYLASFEQFVQAGRIVRRIIDTPMPHIKERRPDLDGIRNVYFALPGEEWRIDAYLLLMETHHKSDVAWNDSQERFQGSLLGYEDWQNDWWIEQRVKRRKEAAK
jgi:hypothetical protein